MDDELPRRARTGARRDDHARRRRCGAATSRSPTPSISTTAGGCSPRPIRARRRSSSPPRPPGCAWLRDAGAVAVPEVLAVSDDRAEPPRASSGSSKGRRRASTEAELGIALARLHQAGAPCFGREDRRTTGSRGLPNEPCATWAEFYATNRLLPLAATRAQRGRALDESTIACARATRGRPRAVRRPASRPPRLHGDLWAGNRLVDRDGRQLADRPGGARRHREFDLAMMRLFGGFGAECFAAYSGRPSADRRLGGAGRAPPDRAARGARDQVRWCATSSAARPMPIRQTVCVRSRIA